MTVESTLAASSRLAIARVISTLLGLVFLVAALAKAASPHAAIRALDHLLPIGRPYAIALTVGIVLLEIAVGVALVASRRSRRTLGAAAAMLVIFTVGVSLLVSDPAAPSCGCVGALATAASDQAANHASLVRNSALLVVCAFGIWCAGAAAPNESRHSQPRTPV